MHISDWSSAVCSSDLRGVGHRVHRSCLGSVLDYSGVEAPKWRTDRAERRAARAGCPCKRLSGRDGSHLGVPKEFDQNGPLLRRDVLKYRHMSSPSLLALGHFASNLDDAAIEYGAYRPCPSPLMEIGRAHV